MNTWLIQILNSFGYLGIIFLIAVENIFPPIPSEIILTFSGFLTLQSNLTPIGVIIAATIGSLIGAIILYYFGSIFSKERILNFINGKWGKRLGFTEKDFLKTLNWFEKKGRYGTLFGRCVPVIRSIVSIPAGMARMKLGEFVLFTTIGSLTWNTVLVILGVSVGEDWQVVVDFFDAYTHIVIVLLAVIGLILIYLWIKMKKTNK